MSRNLPDGPAGERTVPVRTQRPRETDLLKPSGSARRPLGVRAGRLQGALPGRQGDRPQGTQLTLLKDAVNWLSMFRVACNQREHT